MGKSSHKTHKSRKRRRSPSMDRLARLEEKVSRLVDAIGRSEVRSDRSSPAMSVSSRVHRRSPPVSQVDELPEAVEILEDNLEKADLECNLAAPARQEGPSVQCDTGVYACAETIFAEYRRQVDTASPSTRINPRHFSDAAARGNVTFQVHPDGEDASVAASASEDPLTRELFASELESVEVLPWNDLLSNKWQDIVSKGLPAEQRAALLAKYSPPEKLKFLRAPLLNPEVKSALRFNSIAKRDEFNGRDQSQVGVVLCALGEAISEFLKPEIQRSLDAEVRAAVVKVNEGANILADIFFRLSLSRRAQVLPSLNQLAKNTAGAIPADELLFGVSFGEELRKAAALEKSAKDIIRTPVVAARKPLQPTKFQASSSGSGNFRAPVSTMKQPVTRKTGAQRYSHRTPRRSRSQSRRR